MTHSIKDPVARAIAESFGRLIVAQRTRQNLARRVVVQRLGISNKRVRQLEKGGAIVRLDEVVKLAHLYGVNHARLLKDTLQDAAFLRAYDQRLWKA